MSGERKRGRPSYPDILTPAEWHIAQAVRFGLTNRQIAERRGVGIEAVKFHVSNILLKLGMSQRQDLLHWTGMPAVDRQSIKEMQMMEDSDPRRSRASSPPP